jgi:cytosolic 5'-nucleotidase 3
LKNSNVKIKNLDNLEKILTNIAKDGRKSLQVISDFDRTITKYGQKSATSCAVLENSRFVSQDFRLKFDQLRNTYLPIEVDPTMTKDEKVK